MSDEDDLFADSDDDNEEIAAPKKSAPKKSVAVAKSKKNDDDDDLFDSSEEEDSSKKPAVSLKKKSLSKRERIEALAKKKRSNDETGSKEKKTINSKSKPDAKVSGDKKKGSGYQSDSGDSYDSRAIQRTKEDDDFIDTTGEDADAVKELYADQHFDEEGAEEERVNKNKRKRGGGGGDGEVREREELNEEGVPTNPIMAVVHRMKRKKVQKKSLEEKEEEIRTFLGKMELAAEEDEQAVAQRKPALQKLQFLGQVEEMLAKRDMTRNLLDMDVLSVCKRWIQPLPSGNLGNVTVRQRVLEAIAQMNTGNDNGITPNDLKRSELGKVVMILFKHPDETPTIKRITKELIEQWSRPIFQKSGNMKDLERSGRQGTGLAAIKRQADLQQAAYDRQEQQQRREEGSKHANLQTLIASGKSSSDSKASANRVRVPFSKGFAFSVRPVARMESPDTKSAAQQRPQDNRDKLTKRMVEKRRPVSKNQRSANLSVEGRATKG